ncbi:MAG: hypothetical protein JWN86_1484 [Planctomycetota bacterium]|nr:hypothetical protein [Planctomycetota bacterium]
MATIAKRAAFAGGLALLTGLGLGPRVRDADVLVGSWSWSYKDGQGVMHTHVLEVEGTGDKIAARERMDQKPAVKVTDIKVTGGKVTFTVLRDKHRSSYSGKLKGKSSNLIDGLVTVSDGGQTNEYGWQAKKEELKK